MKTLELCKKCYDNKSRNGELNGNFGIKKGKTNEKCNLCGEIVKAKKYKRALRNFVFSPIGA